MREIAVEREREHHGPPEAFQLLEEEDEETRRLIVEKLPPEYQRDTNIFSKFNIDIIAKYIVHDYKIKLLPKVISQLRTSPLYNSSIAKLDTIKEYLLRYLKTRFIKTINTLFTLLVLILKKGDRLLRFYINYRRLNIIIKKDRYLLPLIKETLYISIRGIKGSFLISG